VVAATFGGGCAQMKEGGGQLEGINEGWEDER
jgi:hypothetical protein